MQLAGAICPTTDNFHIANVERERDSRHVVIRLFNAYYPVRTLVLLITEGILVCCSFIVAVIVEFRQDSYLVLNYENGAYKILAVTAVALLCSYFFDLYAPYLVAASSELYF